MWFNDFLLMQRLIVLPRLYFPPLSNCNWYISCWSQPNTECRYSSAHLLHSYKNTPGERSISALYLGSLSLDKIILVVKLLRLNPWNIDWNWYFLKLELLGTCIHQSGGYCGYCLGTPPHGTEKFPNYCCSTFSFLSTVFIIVGIVHS